MVWHMTDAHWQKEQLQTNEPSYRLFACLLASRCVQAVTSDYFAFINRNPIAS